MEIPILTYNVFGDDINPYLGNEDITQGREIAREDFIAILAKMINENPNKTLTEKMIKGLSQLSDNLERVDKNELLGIMDDISIKLAEQINLDAEELKAANYVIASIMEALNSMNNNDMVQNLLNASEQNINEDNYGFLQTTKYDKQDMKLLTELDQEIDYFQNAASENISDIDLAAGLNKDMKQLIAKPEKGVLVNKTDLQAFINSGAEGDSIGSEKNTINIPTLSERQIKEQINQPNLDMKKINESTKDMQAISIPEIKEHLNKYNKLSNNAEYYSTSEEDADILINTLYDDMKDQSGGDEFDFYGKKDTKYASNEIPLSDSRQTFSDSINKNTTVESSIPKQKVMTLESSNINEDKLLISKADGTTLRVAIEPDGMGVLEIELTLEKGIVNAHILASESAGKNFLDNNLSNILNTLLREGLNVGKFSVSLGDRKNGTNDNNERGEQKALKELAELELNSLKNYSKNHLISIFA